MENPSEKVLWAEASDRALLSLLAYAERLPPTVTRQVRRAELARKRCANVQVTI